MTKEEALAWMRITEESRRRWILDAVHCTSEDALYYKGGEDGVYIRMTTRTCVEIGLYEGAVPHIGEALFTPKWRGDFGDHEGAVRFINEHTSVSNPQLGGRA